MGGPIQLKNPDANANVIFAEKNLPSINTIIITRNTVPIPTVKNPATASVQSVIVIGNAMIPNSRERKSGACKNGEKRIPVTAKRNQTAKKLKKTLKIIMCYVISVEAKTAFKIKCYVISLCSKCIVFKDLSSI